MAMPPFDCNWYEVVHYPLLSKYVFHRTNMTLSTILLLLFPLLWKRKFKYWKLNAFNWIPHYLSILPMSMPIHLTNMERILRPWCFIFQPMKPHQQHLPPPPHYLWFKLNWCWPNIEKRTQNKTRRKNFPGRRWKKKNTIIENSKYIYIHIYECTMCCVKRRTTFRMHAPPQNSVLHGKIIHIDSYHLLTRTSSNSILEFHIVLHHTRE